MNGITYSKNTTNIRNISIMYRNKITRKSMYKRVKCVKPNTNAKTVRNVIYVYSNNGQLVKICSKTIRDKANKKIRKPVRILTTIKYCTNNNTHVKSRVQYTVWMGTNNGVYTRHLRRSRQGRRYVNVSVIYMCKMNTLSGTAYAQIYSKSDITEMAENNGQMDIDPEGLKMYGPYGKSTLIPCTAVYIRCTTIIRGNNPVSMYRKTLCIRKIANKCGNHATVIKMHTEHIGGKIHVRNRVRSDAVNIVCWVCIYVVIIYNITRSACSKSVKIQSSNWHKEYGE
jgi:hypothetical protein